MSNNFHIVPLVPQSPSCNQHSTPIFSRQTCEADPSLYPIVLGSLPAYRDPDTRDSFVHLGTFFGCVDLCEKENELKRVQL